ncbi:MAG TPA: trigger factor [Jatrophihabitantaceae bacterium]|nr:trigger factor [Jatrophihabitantaceae bacterium]
MKSSVENVGPTRVKLAVEVPFDELKSSLDAAYKKIGSQVRIPGFRPGKAPARIIDQRVGRSAVLEEAVNDALPRAYSEAVRESGVRALGQPEIEVTKLDDGTSLSFTAEVDVRPEITLPSLEGVEVTVDDIEVTEAEIDEQLDSLRERFATLTGVERPVETGDYVSIDLTASVDGEEVEGGSATGLSYEVGAGDLIDGIDEAIVGKSAGETVSFATTLRQGDKAGAQADVAVTVNSVKRKELPEADDEFAQLASEFDTVEELRADLRERLIRAKTLGQGSQAREKLLEKLVESADFPLPESAVNAEIGYREHDVVHSLGHDDKLFDELLAGQGKTRDEFTAELRESAEKSVRAQFLLDAIADAGQVNVGDAELTEYIVRQAANYDMPPKEFADQIVQGGNLPAMVADMRRTKALATVLESAAITDASGNKVDLSALALSAAQAADAAPDVPPDE